MHQTCTNNIPNNTKQVHIQKISKIYKINTKYQAAAGAGRPKRPKPEAAHGPARDLAAPGLGRAGPAAAWYFSFILYTLDLYLDIIWYICCMFSSKPTTRKSTFWN